tara:strand:- start:262 stop:474 length:213 start_codon:yes stop_codon:yes gene_type:complete
MRIEDEMTIVGLLCGFAIGVCCMMLVNTDTKSNCYEIIEDIEIQVCEECWFEVFDSGDKYQEVQDYIDWE